MELRLAVHLHITGALVRMFHMAKLKTESGTAVLSLGIPEANCRGTERRAGVFFVSLEIAGG